VTIPFEMTTKEGGVRKRRVLSTPRTHEGAATCDRFLKAKRPSGKGGGQENNRGKSFRGLVKRVDWDSKKLPLTPHK
jgi:hypothetical protein